MATDDELNAIMHRKREKVEKKKEKEPSEKIPSGLHDPLLHFEALPPFLKDNEFLKSHHRPQLNSYLECFKSIFRCHSETFNIWTHLIPTLYCAVYTIFLWITVEDSTMKFVFSVYLVSIIFSLGCSSIFHMLCCHSQNVCKVFCKLDYAGIIILIVASFTPWLYYAFYCSTISAIVYQVGVVVFGLACSFVVLQDKFDRPNYRPLRAGLFICLGLSGVIPAIHFQTSEGLITILIPLIWLITMACLYIVGGLVYAARIPERIWPGKFDIFLQSHQIMHLMVVGGVLAGYQGISSLADYRLNNLSCPNVDLPI